MTQGNISKHLIGFTLPLMLGNLIQQVYNLADSVIVGRFVGTDALGAVGSVGSLNFLFFSLCFGLSSGIGILVSQFFGSGEHELVKKSIAQAVYVTLISGILMSIIGAGMADTILHIMKTPEANFDYALTYMRIVCGFTFVNAVYNSISAVLRSLGDSRTPLIFLAAASVINIVLDLLFVVKFGWGVEGAAFATVISQFISAVGSIICGVCINPYLKLKKEHFRIRKDLIRREVNMGLPLAAQSATISVSCIVLQAVVNSFGSTVMAAYTVTSKIEQLVQQPFNSLGIAMSTFAGQNYGASKYDRISKSSRVGIVIVVIFSALMVIVMHMFGPSISGFFVEENDVIEIASQGLRITSLMYIFLGLIYVMRGLLNGVGDVFFSMINGIIEVMGRIGFAFLLIYLFKMDYMAAWYTNGLTWSVTGLISALRFFQSRWKSKT